MYILWQKAPISPTHCITNDPPVPPQKAICPAPIWRSFEKIENTPTCKMI